MKICYFTAAGNSLYVARNIGDGDAELLSIPKLVKEGTLDIEDDAVGIVAPVYDADMPKMVRRFMERARIETDYFFFVYAYEKSPARFRNENAKLNDIIGNGSIKPAVNQLEVHIGHVPAKVLGFCRENGSWPRRTLPT